MQNKSEDRVGSNVTSVKISRDEKAWEAEITAEVTAEAMQTYRESALKSIQKSAKLDGFRPGKAPFEQIVRMYGEAAILREAAQHAIEHELPEILAKENLPIVDTPRVSTDTPETGKPMKFTARAPLAPKIDLPDYQAIAKKAREEKEDTGVTGKEHEDALLHIRRERARIEKVEAGTEPQKAAEDAKTLQEGELPALDDTFVQSLGYPDAEAFSAALKQNLENEKKMRAQEKRRAAILSELVKESKISYPKMLLDYELSDMEARMAEDVSRFGQTLEQYLAAAKKTREDLRKDWEKAADERAKIRLILSKIAAEEKIEPGQAELDHEVEHAIQHYPQANRENIRSHVAHAMRNEMVLRALEGNTEPVGHTGHDHE